MAALRGSLRHELQRRLCREIALGAPGFNNVPSLGRLARGQRGGVRNLEFETFLQRVRNQREVRREARVQPGGGRAEGARGARAHFDDRRNDQVQFRRDAPVAERAPDRMRDRGSDRDRRSSTPTRDGRGDRDQRSPRSWKGQGPGKGKDADKGKGKGKAEKGKGKGKKGKDGKGKKK